MPSRSVVREHVGSKGAKTYTVAAYVATKPIDVTDAFQSEDKAKPSSPNFPRSRKCYTADDADDDPSTERLG